MQGDFDYLGKHYDDNGIEIVYAIDIENQLAHFEANFGLKPDNRDIREIKIWKKFQSLTFNRRISVNHSSIEKT